MGPWQQVEVKAPLHRTVKSGTPVMPVFLPGTADKPELPLFLEEVDCVDMRDWQAEESEGLERLVSGILGKPIGELRMLGR